MFGQIYGSSPKPVPERVEVRLRSTLQECMKDGIPLDRIREIAKLVLVEDIIES
jgi:hypothetical protein